MESFFKKLSRTRQLILKTKTGSKIEADGLNSLKALVFNYTILMTTRFPLSSVEKANLSKALKIKAKNSEEFFHLIWLKNAYCHYLCYTEKNYKKSMKKTKELIKDADQLFRVSFKANSAEKRNTLIILFLNIARLSFFLKNYKKSEQQIKVLSALVEEKNIKSVDIFPKEVRNILHKRYKILQIQLRPKHKKYFMTKFENQLDKIKKHE